MRPVRSDSFLWQFSLMDIMDLVYSRTSHFSNFSYPSEMPKSSTFIASAKSSSKIITINRGRRLNRPNARNIKLRKTRQNIGVVTFDSVCAVVLHFIIRKQEVGLVSLISALFFMNLSLRSQTYCSPFGGSTTEFE